MDRLQILLHIKQIQADKWTSNTPRIMKKAMVF